MKLGLTYDLGEGEQTATVGPLAQVKWEGRTKKKIGDIANGMAMTDLVGLLLEQLRVEGNIPDGAVNEATLAGLLVDINPVDLSADPTQEAAPQG